MKNHWNRSIGLISAVMILSAEFLGAIRSGGVQPRPGPILGCDPILTARAGGGAHPALLTEADRQRMRVRTALFTEKDRELTVMRTALFTEKDRQRMSVRNAVFKPVDQKVPGSPSAIGRSGR